MCACVIKENLWATDSLSDPPHPPLPPRRGCEPCVQCYWWLQLEAESPRAGSHTLPYLSPHAPFLMGNITLRLLWEGAQGNAELLKRQRNPPPHQSMRNVRLFVYPVDTCFDSLLCVGSSAAEFVLHASLQLHQYTNEWVDPSRVCFFGSVWISVWQTCSVCKGVQVNFFCV